MIGISLFDDKRKHVFADSIDFTSTSMGIGSSLRPEMSRAHSM